MCVSRKRLFDILLNKRILVNMCVFMHHHGIGITLRSCLDQRNAPRLLKSQYEI